ncbi:hypothetical protein IH992_00005, partial [Candidatus Poribacteria bacterium]|nr:hypothetical protein [Candidatus Poribacteria bacterium]
ALDYFIDFARPVGDLSLNLYDYHLRPAGAGGAGIGDTATLTAFADAARTVPVGTDVFTIISDLPDGNVATLSISNPSALILAASLVFSTGDAGNGIDNIRFITDLVDIDLKPGNNENVVDPFNLTSNKPVNVAVLSTTSFDATTLDLTTVKLGDPLLTPTVDAVSSTQQDVNGDGLTDVVFNFGAARDFGNAGALDANSVAVLLTGTTPSGTVVGHDDVKIVGGGNAPPAFRPRSKLTTTWGRIKTQR